MAQTLLNSDMIAKAALMHLKNALGFTRGVNRQYDNSFANKGAQIGNSINIRLPQNFEVSDGKIAQLQGVQNRTVPLVLEKQKHVAFKFSSSELTLNIEQFSERYLRPACVALANKVDIDGLLLAKTSVFNSVGTPGAAPSSLETYLEAHEKLDNMACPSGDRTMLINPRTSTKIVTNLLQLHESSAELKKQYRDGVMSRAAGFEWRKSVNINRHTVGQLGGAPLVDSANQDGSEIDTKGWTSAAANRLKAGDVVSFTGVYSVNPVTLEPTESLAQFVITEDIDSDVSGDATLKIFPAIVTSGPYKNVSAAPSDEAPVLIFGHASSYASKVTTNNIAYHKDAFVLGCADLEIPKGVDMAGRESDSESGLSIRFVRQYDVNIDDFISRLDILYGWKAIRPEWSCRVQG